MIALTKTSRRLSRSSGAVLIALTACLALTGARGVRRPVQIRIEGYFEAAPSGVRSLRTVMLQIGKGKQRAFAVRELVNLGGGTLGSTILDEVARYKPAFRLAGDRTALDRLEAAPAGALVKLMGNLSADRYLLVSSAEVSPT